MPAFLLYWTLARSGQKFRNCPAQFFDGKGLSNDRIDRLVRISELLQIGSNRLCHASRISFRGRDLDFTGE